MRSKGTKFVPALALAPAGLVFAAPLDPVVRERQTDMKAMAAAVKSISEFFSGKTPYEADVFRSDARSIADLGGERLIGHFANVVTTDGSNAREDIATGRGKFAKLARDLEAYARQVAAAAADGETMPAAMRMRPAETTEGGPFARKTGDRAGCRRVLFRARLPHDAADLLFMPCGVPVETLSRASRDKLP